MKKLLMLSLTLMLSTQLLKAQYTECAVAINQLQYYAQNVNQIYTYEYNNLGYKCGYNWQWCLSSLNQWYYNQCVYVNQTYATICYQCANRDSAPPRAPNRKPTDRGRDIDDDMTDVEDDIEEQGNSNKKVRLHIPESPSGWNP